MLVHIQDNRLGEFTYDDTEYELKNIQRKKTLIFKDKNTSRTDIVIPAGIKVCDFMFKECRYLEQAPKIPTSVISCNGMFHNCIRLKKVPKLPNQIRYTQHMFGMCQSLVNAPNIPSDIRNCSNMFGGCISLKKAPIFDVNIHFEKCESMFYDCTNLQTFNYKRLYRTMSENTSMYKGCNSLVQNFAFPKTLKQYTLLINNLYKMNAHFVAKKEKVDLIPLCVVPQYKFNEDGSLEKYFRSKALRIPKSRFVEVTCDGYFTES